MKIKRTGKNVKTATSTKRKFTVKASKHVKKPMKSIKAETETDTNERIKREDFAENLIQELENEYSIKISNNTWGKIIDLADDLDFGKDAEKYGSTPLNVLENAIYDIIEEDTGTIIGSTQKKQFTVKASKSAKKSKIMAGGTYPEYLESKEDCAEEIENLLKEKTGINFYIDNPDSIEYVASRGYVPVEIGWFRFDMLYNLGGDYEPLEKYTGKDTPLVNKFIELDGLDINMYSDISIVDSDDLRHGYIGGLSFDVISDQWDGNTDSLEQLNKEANIIDKKVCAEIYEIRDDIAQIMMRYVVPDDDEYIEESTSVGKNNVINAAETNQNNQDDSLIDDLWDACYDVDDLQDIDFEASDTDGTHIIFIYGNSTNDYDSRESQLISALTSAGYDATYDSSNGTNVIVLRVIKSVNSATLASKCSYVTASTGDVNEIKDVIWNAGFSGTDVKETRTHLGTEYKILIGGDGKEKSELDGSSIIDTLRSAGYIVEFDTVVDGWMYLFITDNHTDPKYLYRVSYDYTSDIVEMDDETSDYQAVIDKLIDDMESTGNTGYLISPDEAAAEYSEDMYTIGGNHGLAFIHNGNLNIEPLGWSDEVDVQHDTVHSSTDVSYSEDDEIIWEPIPESIDDAGKHSIWSTTVNGESFWIVKNSNGRYDVERNQSGRYVPVSEELANLGSLYDAEREFDMWLEENEFDINSATNIKASIGGKSSSTDDYEYYKALADRVVELANEHFNDRDLTNIVYEISDKMLTFSDIAGGRNEVVYIIPLENITPNWDDLESDADELYESMMGSLLPF